MDYMIFDEETTIFEKYKRKANPFIPENWVVAEGWYCKGDKQASWRYMTEAESRSSFMRIPEHINMLVGFNIKFDLLWELVRKNTDFIAFLKRGGKIWDCQYAEYLLRAQHPAWHMCSLNDTAVAYGGTAKIDAVKAMWEEGINTPDIPEDLLIDYLVGTEAENRLGGDIGNTLITFKGQYLKAHKSDMLQMITDRMDGLLATTFMEFFGLKVDTEFARSYLKQKKAELAVAEEELAAFIPELPPELEFNWNSNTHTSCLIFGGTVKYQKKMPYHDADGKWARKQETERWPLFDGEQRDPTTCEVREEDGLYFYRDEVDVTSVTWQDTFKGGKRMGEPKFKNVKVPGERKTRLTDQFFRFKGYTKPSSRWKGEMTDGKGEPIYQTNKKVMEALALRDDVPFLVALANFTALTKEIGTYLVARDSKGSLSGMLTCVSPDDHIIHHKLNHVNTVTSRLSSSEPNLQNLTRGDFNSKTGKWKSEVKKMFISRFKNGEMVEADYSQLEVVVQGVLTGDKQLCQDLNDRVDFHCKRVALQHGISYEVALYRCKDDAYEDKATWGVYRTKAKNFSFQRAYGAGASAIAESTKMLIDEVEKMIANEDAEYPGIKKFFDAVTTAIEDSAEPIRQQRDNGSWGVFRRGYWQAPTGTMYTWRSYDAPDFLKKRGIMDSFAHPEIMNYPVQGTGGEFVQCVLGLLIRDLIKKDFYGTSVWEPRVILCNTVHDCVWYDCAWGMGKKVWEDIKPIMESIPEHYNTKYGMNITVPFPVDGETGLNMNELGHFQ